MTPLILLTYSAQFQILTCLFYLFFVFTLSVIVIDLKKFDFKAASVYFCEFQNIIQKIKNGRPKKSPPNNYGFVGRDLRVLSPFDNIRLIFNKDKIIITTSKRVFLRPY